VIGWVLFLRFGEKVVGASVLVSQKPRPAGGPRGLNHRNHKLQKQKLAAAHDTHAPHAGAAATEAHHPTEAHERQLDSRVATPTVSDARRLRGEAESSLGDVKSSLAGQRAANTPSWGNTGARLNGHTSGCHQLPHGSSAHSLTLAG
jgi:hypothetical protein